VRGVAQEVDAVLGMMKGTTVQTNGALIDSERRHRVKLLVKESSSFHPSSLLCP